jgi:hypothetical protein
MELGFYPWLSPPVYGPSNSPFEFALTERVNWTMLLLPNCEAWLVPPEAELFSRTAEDQPTGSGSRAAP